MSTNWGTKILRRSQIRKGWCEGALILTALARISLLVLVILLSFQMSPHRARLIYRLHGDMVEAQTEYCPLLWGCRLPQPHPGSAHSRSPRQRFPGALLLEGSTLYGAAAILYTFRADDGVILWTRAVLSVFAFFTAIRLPMRSGGGSKAPLC